MTTQGKTIPRVTLAIFALLFTACSSLTPQQTAEPFTIAVIPDTQNMVSYKHQPAEGFALDAGAQFQQQMATIANWRDDRGQPLAFAIGVGDVWQHQSKVMDENHRERGFKAIDNPYFGSELAVTDRVLSEEIPRARQGYQQLADAGIPFGVAPGNHDHDAMWSAEGFPPKRNIPREQLQLTPEYLGMLHIGGLDNFRSVFGADGEFYAGKPWYVDSHDGGASSAQTFGAGGYTFLHIALEMQPSDEVVEWALQVVDRHRGLPTIVSTHDFLSTAGERLPNPLVDLARIDPDYHNNAEQLWEKLLSQRDEIFLVLSGHQHGQSRRLDSNANGYQVHQVLADYQSRGQSALDAGQPMNRQRSLPPGVGDGWFRLMEFKVDSGQPVIRVRTYSSHYGKFSSELPEYAQWYRKYEQPQMSEEEFLAEEEFELQLPDFHQRFGKPR
jgi:hypothetical protein